MTISPTVVQIVARVSTGSIPYGDIRPNVERYDTQMSSMNSLTEHMGLCSVPTWGQCQDQDFIFGPHHFSPITSDLNFPITIPVSGQEWICDIHLFLDSVMNLHQEGSYTHNFTLGFILRHRETGGYRYLVPLSNNSFFSRPVRIDHPSSWREDLGVKCLLNWVMKRWHPMWQIIGKTRSGFLC